MYELHVYESWITFKNFCELQLSFLNDTLAGTVIFHNFPSYPANVHSLEVWRFDPDTRAFFTWSNIQPEEGLI